MPRAAFYIDGFNLYHALEKLNSPRLKWVDHWKLASSYLSPADTLTHVKFYTAVLTWERTKQERHKLYIRALKAVGCTVVESRFARVSKHCRVMKRTCARHEEKQTDVAIATGIIADGVNDLYDTAYLVTADSDQVPTIRTFRALFANKRLILIAPPGNETGARELGALAHSRKRMTDGRIRANLLPEKVPEGRTTINMPAGYREAPERIV